MAEHATADEVDNQEFANEATSGNEPWLRRSATERSMGPLMASLLNTILWSFLVWEHKGTRTHLSACSQSTGAGTVVLPLFATMIALAHDASQAVLHSAGFAHLAEAGGTVLASYRLPVLLMRWADGGNFCHMLTTRVVLCAVLLVWTPQLAAYSLSSPPPCAPLNTTLAPRYVWAGVVTLQDALAAASPGDEYILDGRFARRGDNVLDITKDCTIRAQNTGQAVLDGQGCARGVLYILSGTVLLEGLRIAKGTALV